MGPGETRRVRIVMNRAATANTGKAMKQATRSMALFQTGIESRCMLDMFVGDVCGRYVVSMIEAMFAGVTVTDRERVEGKLIGHDRCEIF